MWAEVLAVCVYERDEIAVQHAQRAPHRVALAEHRPERRHQPPGAHDVRAEPRGDRAGAVARVVVEHDDLIYHAGLAQRY